MDAGQISIKCIHNKCLEIDKKCQRLKKYKKPISLYYLSDVGVSLKTSKPAFVFVNVGFRYIWLKPNRNVFPHLGENP